MNPEKPKALETDEKLREVWVQLDPSRRARVVSLLAQMAYNFVIAQREISTEENINDQEIKEDKVKA